MDFLSPNIFLILIILVGSAIFHEVAHGWVAERLGDPTARLQGRITLNPIPHIDPIMTIMMPLVIFIASGGSFIFGGAKPVPVDPFNLRDGRRDMALVSLAGPGTNILIAILFAGLIHLSRTTGIATELSGILYLVVWINLLLAIFNLIPIPPLDGSKIFSLLLPEREASAYLSIGSMGIFILFAVLFLFPSIGGFSVWGILLGLLQAGLRLLGLG